MAVAPADFVWGADRGPAHLLDRIRRACHEEDGHDPLDEATQLHLKRHGLEGSRLWLLGDSGFALLHDGSLDLAVTPPGRGRGAGRALAAAALDVGGPARAWSHGNHPAAESLARRFGMERVRDLWVMRRRGHPPEDRQPPDGIRIRAYEPSDADALLEVNAAAFAGHPEQAGMDAGNLADRMGEDWFDPAGLLVAEDADRRMLGFHWTKQHSARLGEVYVIGIAPRAQGRGLGKALTVAGLQHMGDLGVIEVFLYVESDNDAGIATYSSLGFTHAEQDTHVMYRR